MLTLTHSNPENGRPMLQSYDMASITFISDIRIFNSHPRKHNSLLGPCYKTGSMEPFRQHAEHADGLALLNASEMHPACRRTPPDA